MSPIKKFIESRGINSLYHFTKIENLKSILERGLLSLDELNSGKIPYEYNDNQRRDNREDAICVSISFPNYRMFYKYRRENPSDKWCILELDPSVLYDKNCLFCIENAASTKETTRSNDDKVGISGLVRLFEDEDYRISNNILSNFTTNPQAEVLVLGNIEPSYIKNIKFQEKTTSFPFNEYPDFGFHYHPNLFSCRHDYENWR